MKFEVKMPDLAATESEMRIVRWLIEPGQKVERGQSLVEVETDKATMEVESIVSGVLLEVRFQVDEKVSVGQVIAVLEVEETTTQVSPPGSIQAPEAVAASDTSRVSANPASLGAGRRVGIFARNRAAAAGSVAPATGFSLSVAQRTAARRLQESKQTIPHFYLLTTANASGIVARRKAAEPVNLAWDAFFVLAVARAIVKFDRFRCRLDGERLAPIESDAIGVAVDVDNELYVIPIGSPDTKTVEQISAEIRQSVERLRSGDPESRRIRPALLTVTNLGICKIEAFVPIINPPEAAILGVGRVVLTPVAKSDGSIDIEPRCTLTLSVDHRVTSGKYAGDFLGAVVKELESI